MSRKRSVDLAIALVAVAVLIVLIALRASVSEDRASLPSTFDTGLRGYAALYSLLEREDVRTQYFEEPLSQLFKRHGTFVIAGDYALAAVAASKTQSRALDAWVRSGATLAIFGNVPSWLRAPLGLPELTRLSETIASGGCGLQLRDVSVAGEFTQGMAAGCTNDRVTLLRAGRRAVAIAYRRGKGTIIFAPTPTIFDNEHLAQRANAQFAYTVFSDRGTVAFEERMYGHATGRSFWQILPLPMRAAVILASIAVLLAVVGANLPFAPPQTPPGVDERDSSEYIASLARMLQRGGAQREIVRRLCAHAAAVLGPRAVLDEDARTLLERAQALQSLSRPSAEDVMAAGRLVARVRKEYEW